jgi:hypothetical protein
MKKKQVPLPFLIEEGVEDYGDIQDQERLGVDYFCDTEYPCDGSDIGCQDGCCPDCNYKDWLRDQGMHNHCGEPTFTCPDPDTCPEWND